MVGRPGQYQFSFNAGELAPAVQGNTGLKQFYAGAYPMLNAEPVPQGGFRLLPRSRYRAQLPRALDSAGIPAARSFAFGVARAKTYVLVVTPGLGTIFKGGIEVATVVLPYVADDIASLKANQRFDTMLLTHAAYATRRLLNDGTDGGWSVDVAPFTNVPQVQIGGSYVNTVEKWVVYLNADTGPDLVGALFTISVNGSETSVLTYAAADMSTTIRDALLALPTVDPGLAVVRQTSGDAFAYYELQFDGANAGGNFIVSGRVVTPTSASLQTWREAIGKLGGENLFSDARGYATCSVYYQDRLVLGGFAARTTAFALSRTGEYFDLNILLTSVASGALLLNLSADGAETIVDVAQSKHLVLFTDYENYYVADRAISATAAPSIVSSSSRIGCSRRVPVVVQESSLLYVNREETILYAAAYDAVSDAYVSTPLSLLSSHIVAGIRDAALQRSYAATDSQRHWMPRDDGSVTVACLIRNQDVSAFVRWETDGQVRAVSVDGDNLVHVLVDRVINGAPVLCLETLEDGLLLDQAITSTSAAPRTIVGGLDALEGATVWAIADGYVEGPYTVSAAAIALRTASSTVTVGRWTPPVVGTLPLVRDVAAHMVLKRPARVHSVKLDVIASSSLAVGANDRPARDVSLVPWQAPADRPPDPRTGQIAVAGLQGWSDDGRVVFTQVRPGPLEVRNVTVEAKI